MTNRFSIEYSVGWLARSSSSGERSATSLKTGSWRRVSWCVLVRVAGQDAEDAGTDHLQEAVLGKVEVAGIVEGGGEGPGQPDALVELVDGEQPGVAGELARRRLDHQRRAEKVQDLWPGGGYTHRMSSWLRKKTWRLQRLDAPGDKRFRHPCKEGERTSRWDPQTFRCHR
jgi:hypothetical protein